VEDRHDDLEGRNAHLLVLVDGNAASVVGDAHRIVGMNRHLDRVAVAGKGLVDGVVEDFLKELVQAPLAVVADVHARTLADGFQSLENLDLIGVVIAQHLAGQFLDLLELVIGG
jgi:hypothetical protein